MSLLNKANTVAVLPVQAVQNQEGNYSNSYKNGIPSRGQSNHVADVRPSPFDNSDPTWYNNSDGNSDGNIYSMYNMYNAVKGSNFIKFTAHFIKSLRYGTIKCQFCKAEMINHDPEITEHKEKECFYQEHHRRICIIMNEKEKTLKELKDKINTIKIIKSTGFYAKKQIIMSQVLVISTIIEIYNGGSHPNKLANLPIYNVKDNIIKLFAGNYNYNVISNNYKYCSKADFKSILSLAKELLKYINYQSIIILFCGHGDEHNLFFSDFTTDPKNGTIAYNCISRVNFESLFNEAKELKALKLYAVDACRGYVQSKAIHYEELYGIDMNINNNNNKRFMFGPDIIKPIPNHPNQNRIVLYPNTTPYIALGIEPIGGYLLHSLCDVFRENIHKYMNILTMIDEIKQKMQTNSAKMANRDLSRLHDAISQLEIRSTAYNDDLIGTIFTAYNDDHSNDLIINLAIGKYSTQNVLFS